MYASTMARVLVACLITLALGWLVNTQASAAGEYTVTDIGTLVGTGDGQFDVLVNTVPRAINEDGEVIANATGANNRRSVPFTFRDGKLERLGNEQVKSVGEDINDRGEIAGSETNSEGLQPRAVVWRDRTPVVLPTLGGTSMAMALNNKGEIVGYSEVAPRSFEYHPVLWQGDEVIDLGTFGGRFSIALDINESTTIVGESDAPGEGGLLPFRWEGGTIEELPLPEGFTEGSAVSINDAGTIVGVCRSKIDDSTVGKAVRWENGEPEFLASLVDDGQGYAVSVNSPGQAVGWSALDKAAEDFTAVIWENGSVTDLNTLIPDDSGYTLQSAQAINDAGQIVVLATSDEDEYRHGLLLSPVDDTAARLSIAFDPVDAATLRD